MGSHRKLGVKSDHRVAMLRNMTADLITHGRIRTTVTRAKELRRVAERTITLGKRGDLHARRQALAYLYDKDAVYKLFEEVAPKYKDRNGGYTRILRIGPRRGDGAEMAIIELVE
ncbi:MAG TPA: 50S ribosomal protein L17 [Clostridiales bacterium]|jgi:large subunit ribosomal protein L17|nr:50S ribosomal protein L17 [Clostridiales bacterium]HCS12050.1 50S ribosomal protein L17 [Clostridiales bacterium]